MAGSMMDVTLKRKTESELHGAEQKLNAIFDSVLDGISVFNMEGHMTYLNNAQATINGYASPEDMKQHLEYFAKTYELQFPNGEACPIQKWPVSRVFGGESFQDYILIGKRVDINRQWTFNFSGSPVYGENGKMSLAVVVTKDITAQSKAEENYRRQSDLTKLITSNATTGLLIMDSQQKCVFMNASAEKIIGYSLSEIQRLNKPLHDIIHHKRPDGSHYPMSECPIDRALPTQNNMSGTDHFVRPDGSLYPVSFNASPIVENGSPVGTVIELRDITKELQREAALRKSEEQFRVFANNIQNLAWMAEPQGQIFWYNQQWFDYTDTTLEEMKGTGWVKVHHPDHVQRIVDFLEVAWQKGEPFELTFPLRSKTGEYRRFLTRVYPVKSDDGTLLSWIGTNTDIEEEMAFTEKLDAEVKQRTKELAASNENLLRFAHVASHDLKEPVRKINIFGNMLKDQSATQLDERSLTYLEKMLSASVRVGIMIDGILQLSTTSSMNDKFVEVDLNAIIQGILNDLELTIREKRAIIKVETLPVIEGIPLLLHQLFYNLINNSLKFCVQRPLITII